MRVYLDTSVVVSALHRDAHHERAKTLLTQLDQAVMSSWVLAEFTSAATMLLRRQAITGEGARAMYLGFAVIAEAATMVEVINEDVLASAGIVKSAMAALRAPDALHLAICQRLGLELATFDAAMAEAARAVGLAVAAT